MPLTIPLAITGPPAGTVLAVLLKVVAAAVGVHVEFAVGTSPGLTEPAPPLETLVPASPPPAEAPGEGALGHPVASSALHD